MKKETVDIVEELISQLEVVVPFNVVTDNLDGTYTIESCNTGYLFPCYKFELDGVNYTVLNEVGKEFVFNVKFTIKGNVVPTSVQLIMEGLKYYHGTVIATKEELAKKQLTAEKFPMAYLFEVLEDDFDDVEESSIDRISRLRLFFLCETDENNWTTKEHYEFAIKPMRNLFDKFIFHLNKSPLIGKFKNHKGVNHAKFGVFMATKGGHTQRIFNDQLSGVELRIDLPIKKTKDCCECDTTAIIPTCLPATIIDSDGITPFEVISGGTGACTVVTQKSGIKYDRVRYTGAKTSYHQNDDAWNREFNPPLPDPINPTHTATLDNSAAEPFLTLVDNNIHGNKNRFCDNLGTQIYVNSVIVDHLTGDSYLMEDANTNILFPLSNFSDSIIAATTYVHNALGYNNYMIPNAQELLSVENFEASQGIRYFPFNQYITASNFQTWTSTTLLSSASSGLRVSTRPGLLINHSKTSTSDRMLVRHHL